MSDVALVNCDIYTGEEVVHDKALLVRGERIMGLVPLSDLPTDVESVDLAGRSVAPGFIDLQINGGGGHLFNATPSVEAVRAIGRAHQRYGTTAFLPTYITGPCGGVAKAVQAVQDCISQGVPGVLGIHLEGPFLNPSKAGVHDAELMRQLTAEDLGFLETLKDNITLVTLAPEVVEAEQIRALRASGLRLAAGHTNASYVDAKRGFEAGVTLTTHLFNAMSPYQSREPGMVGAALESDDSWCSVIVDGFHVHYTSLRVAWKAKARGKMLLVTDAMPPVGCDSREFRLGRRVVTVVDGRCVTSDGTLAGSALDMATAVRNCVQKIGIPLDEALRMASTYPAEFLGLGKQFGRVRPGYRADLVVFNNQVRVTSVMAGGSLEHFE